jgi:tetratricopeptide (TPR) repeat protein
MIRAILKIVIFGLLLCETREVSRAEDRPISPVKTLLNENRLDEASAICRQYEVLSTRDKDDRFACAWVYLRNQQSELAEKILDEQKSNAKLAEYQLLQGYSLTVQKKYDEAKRIFERVAASNKGKLLGVNAQELIAEMYDSQEKLGPAAFIYNLVLKEDPNRGQATWGMARFYQSQNDIRRTIQYLEMTAKLWPKHIPSRFMLAKINFGLGPDYASVGFNWLKESYRLNKSNPEVLEEIGSFFERSKKIPEAVKYWQKAVAIKPDLVLANNKIKEYFSETIKQLFETEKFEEVIEKLETNKSLSQTPDLTLIKGQSYRSLGKYSSAITELKEFLKSSPKNPLANRELGISYVNEKYWDLAVEAFSKAVMYEPSNAFNLGWFAYALEEKGDLIRAKEYWEKALGLFEEPQERDKAARKIASIEKRLKKKNKSQEEDD